LAFILLARITGTPFGTTVWTQKYMYDQQGNRRFDTGTTIPVGFPNPTINTANDNRIDTSQGYLYDLAGNVTQDLSHAYTFDAEERQTKVDNGATGTYSYDGRGQRVKSISSLGTTLCVYDAMGRLVAEYTSGNATGSGTSYITADALGSPRVITAQDKSVKARHDYLPFGEEIPVGYGSRTTQQGYVADGLRQKFTGKERDGESGLNYFGARYYSSPIGRFASLDPSRTSVHPDNPQTWNRYVYALNRVTIAIDPDGLATIIVVVSPRASGGTGQSTTYLQTRGGYYVRAGRDNGRRYVAEYCRLVKRRRARL
jgi:RHS repeat-associated protein